MRPDHRHGVAGSPLLPDGKGDDGGSVAGQIILPAGLELRGPVVPLLDGLEAGSLQAGNRRGDGMVC